MACCPPGPHDVRRHQYQDFNRRTAWMAMWETRYGVQPAGVLKRRSLLYFDRDASIILYTPKDDVLSAPEELLMFSYDSCILADSTIRCLPPSLTTCQTAYEVVRRSLQLACIHHLVLQQATLMCCGLNSKRPPHTVWKTGQHNSFSARSAGLPDAFLR